MVTLQHFDPPNARVAQLELPLTKPGDRHTVSVRCVPGAERIAIVLADDAGDVISRHDITARGGERLKIELERRDHHQFSVRSRNRDSFRLASRDERQTELLPMRRPDVDKTLNLDQSLWDEPNLRAKLGAQMGVTPLDLVLIVDGTTLTTAEGGDTTPATYLLGPGAARQNYLDQLETWVRAIAEPYFDLNISVIAFGDDSPYNLAAEDLEPRYNLWPHDEDDRHLTPLDFTELSSKLDELEPTSGVDYVDALADALADARKLRWREDARKLLLITGDSPGYAIEHPFVIKTNHTTSRSRRSVKSEPPAYALSLTARRHDVDTEATLLHQLGVEIATAFHDLLTPDKHSDLHAMREYTYRQYQRLATTPQMAFLHSQVTPEQLAEQIHFAPGIVGRGSVLAVLDDGNAARVAHLSPRRHSLGPKPPRKSAPTVLGGEKQPEETEAERPVDIWGGNDTDDD